jgi:excinuclease ABC subunit A
VKGGRCEACQGDGLVKIEMHFLPDVYVPCEVCKGRRYNRETLEVRYKGRSIADVLDLTVADALDFFSNQRRIAEKLELLNDVGLGYIHLGQAATTLSGGEAQRVKLATELAKRDTGRTLYILDEPTTGLHFEDVRLLLEVLHRLVDKGNSVVVIEHNLDVIKTADWIVDLGPEGGERGGKVVAEGTPEEVAAVEGSHTGHFLRRVLPSLSP